MTRAVKIRLIAFGLLSAFGIFYASANYLGLVDTLLDRGYTVVAELGDSGGLYVGSEVTYRGVPIGNVGEMEVTPDGVRADLEIEEGWQVPAGTRAEVHNESAVGEQYIDLLPETASAPYLEDGSVIRQAQTDTPLPEEKLLLHVNDLLTSVPRDDLRTVVDELGNAFEGTAPELQRLIDGGTSLIDTAHRNLPQTTRLILDAQRVLATQDQQAGNIATLADNLADLTQTLRSSDGDLRRVLRNGASGSRQIQDLVRRIGPTMPVLLENFTTLGQVTTVRLPAVEQLLVAFPRVISSGFTGTTPDGYGHVNLQFAQDPPVCREGYLPEHMWRSPMETTDGVLHDEVRCEEPLPTTPRGAKHAPKFGSPDPGSTSANRTAPFAATTGDVVTPDGRRFTVRANGGQQELFGEDSWRWMLIGPLTRR
ncbi:MAG TPA: MlaD family protein [Nocardioidaceae bacterium]|nr:MlaD family protein [Nocardioidaceae bacterium]